MSSDYYRFEGKIGVITIQAVTIECRSLKDAEEMNELRLRFFNAKGEPVKLGNRNSRIISQWIIAGYISMRYTGGFCPTNNDYWGVDDIRHSNDKEGGDLNYGKETTFCLPL